MFKSYFNSYKGNDITFDDRLAILNKLAKEFNDITTIAKLNNYINHYNRKIDSNFDLYYNYKEFKDYIKDKLRRKKNKSTSSYSKEIKKEEEETIREDNKNNSDIVDILNKLTTKELKELQHKLDIPDNFIRSWKLKLWKPSNKMMKQIVYVLDS